jgi:hypothetical protein
MESITLLDCAGRPRSPATMSSFYAGSRLATKGCVTQPTRRPLRRSWP